MAAAAMRAKDVRMYLAGFFTLFLAVNVVLIVMAALAELNNQQSLQLLPADFPPAGRLLILAIGLGISWAVGHYLYMFLVDGEVHIGEASTASLIFLLYFLFLFAGIAFLNALGWMWLAVGFVVLLAVSILALWRIVGAGFVVAGLAVAGFAAWLAFYLLG